MGSFRKDFLCKVLLCRSSSSEISDPMILKRALMRWCAVCVVAVVMIVAWETGFYMASMTQDRKLLGRNGRVHGVQREAQQVEDPKVKVERLQAERRSTLEEECHRLDLPSQVSEYTIKHFLVVEDYKLAYCFIPKVGCSNWKRIMMVLNNQTDSVDHLTSDEVHLNGKYKFLSTYPPAKREEILREYKTFFFVRHPFERVLSVFKNKLESLKNFRDNRFFHRFGREIVKRWRPDASELELQTGENVTWPEFVQYLTHTERRGKFEQDVYLSDHWREMYKICSPCAVKYDFMGHLENVGDESRYLLEKVGAPSNAHYLGAESSRPTNSSDKSTYESYYTQLSKDDLTKLWNIFEKDFTLFGYPKPWFVP